MKFFFLMIFLFCACTKENSGKPILTVAEYEKEKLEILGVIEKLMSDQDANRIHAVAVGLQSTFAVDCKPIGEECTIYHNIITAIINATNDRILSLEEKMDIIKMRQELEQTFKANQAKLALDWKKYQ